MNEHEIVQLPDAKMIENVLIGGDLGKLSPEQRVVYYQKVCESLGLNPLTKPFGYITLNGKLVLYALREAAEQLRRKYGVNITALEKQWQDDLYIVTAHASLPNGRADASTGAVSVKDLKGDAKANAIMKAETKAKRRVTLSICGLGFMDESEVSSIPGAAPVVVTETGEIGQEIQQAHPEDEHPAVELIDPMGQWAVQFAAKQWNISESDAAKEIAKQKLGKRIEKADFEDLVKGTR